MRGSVVSRILMLSLVLAGAASRASAHDYELGTLKLTHPWSRATPGGAKVAAGYLKIVNTGTKPDRLVAAQSTVAGAVEIHEMATTDAVMKMRALSTGLVIAPGQTVELAPGGYHVMFIDLKGPIVQDQPFKARLKFEKAGEVEIEFKVEAIGAQSSGNGHKH